MDTTDCSDEEILPLAMRIQNAKLKLPINSTDILEITTDNPKLPNFSPTNKVKRKANVLTPNEHQTNKRVSLISSCCDSNNLSIFDSSQDLFKTPFRDFEPSEHMPNNYRISISPSCSFLNVSNTHLFSDAETDSPKNADSKSVYYSELYKDNFGTSFIVQDKTPMRARFSLMSDFDSFTSPNICNVDTPIEEHQQDIEINGLSSLTLNNPLSETSLIVPTRPEHPPSEDEMKPLSERISQNNPPLTKEELENQRNAQIILNQMEKKAKRGKPKSKKNVPAPNFHYISDSDDSDSRDLTEPFCNKQFSQKFTSKLNKEEQKLNTEEKKVKKKMARDLIKVRNAQLKGDLQFIQIIISHDFYELGNCDDLISLLTFNELKHTFVQYLPTPLSIKWQREVLSNDGDDPTDGTVTMVTENQVLICIPLSFITPLITQYKINPSSNEMLLLRNFHQENQALNPDCKIWYTIMGLKNFFKKKNKNPSNKNKLQSVSNQVLIVTDIDIEEALIVFCNEINISINPFETMTEFSQFLMHTTKSISQSQYKKQKRNNYAWAFSKDNSATIKIDKDGKGCLKLWKKQLEQFNNTSKEITNTIATLFPSPQLLLKAYSMCSNQKEAINILKNLTITRGIGSSKTTRLVGPKLSQKVYTFLTSKDGDLLLT